MSNEEINELFYTLQQEFSSRATQIAPTWEVIFARQAQTSTSQQTYNFEGGNYFNNNAGYFSQPHNYMPSYYKSSWGTHNNFSYGHPIMQSQGSLSSYYQEQFRQLYNEELFVALKEEIKRDNEALPMRLPIMETKMDAKMIADMVTSSRNLRRETNAIMERTKIQAKELANILKEQSSRQLPRDIKNNDIWESESISLSLEEELSCSTLDEDKNTIECDKMPLVIEGKLQDLTFVENNELVIDEEPLLEDKQVEKQHPERIMENILVGVEDFYFPIESLTFGMDEDRHVSFIEKPSSATSQMWIDAENGEIKLLVGEKKMKFDLHQSKPLTDGERRACKKLESSFAPIEEPIPKILQEDTLKGYELRTNSFPTKELEFKLTSPISKVEELIS